jgi:hypothetical protein
VKRSGIARRTFVIGGSIAAVAAATAGVAWLRSGKSLIADVELLLESDAPETITAAFAETILALEDARFPRLDPAAIVTQAYDAFQLRGDERFAQTLRLFDVLAAFEAPPAAFRDAEIELYGQVGSDPTDQAAWYEQRVSIDSNRFESWFGGLRPGASHFTKLGLEQRRGYVGLWCTSALGVRRRIYKTLRAVVYSIAFSDPSVWRAIGYEGPFVAPTPR